MFYKARSPGMLPPFQSPWPGRGVDYVGNGLSEGLLIFLDFAEGAGGSFANLAGGAHKNYGKKLSTAADAIWVPRTPNISAAAPSFTQSSGSYGPVYRFTATTAKVSFGPSTDFVPLTYCTIMCGARKTDATNRTSGLFGLDNSGGSTNGIRCGAHVPYSDGKVYWDFGGGIEGNGRLSYTPSDLGDDLWVMTAGKRGMEIWKNGNLKASNSSNNTRTTNSANYTLGNHGNQSADLVEYWIFAMWNRQLSQNEIVALYQNPFAPVMPRTLRSYGLVQGNPPIGVRKKVNGPRLAPHEPRYDITW